MKNLSVIFIVLSLLPFSGFAQKTAVQSNETPPLLIQQSPPLNVVPPLPGPGPAVSAPPAPALGPAGVSPIQTIPMQTILNNLNQAVITSKKVNKLLTSGKVWVTRAPSGEIEIKAGLLYQGSVVALLHFDPLSGNILPLGIVTHTYQNNVQLQSIKTKFSSAVGSLKILPFAEFLEPEACWLFPVVLNNIVVTHIKIYYDGIHVLQDYAANQEMVFYGN
jgi:hypothetical protein